MQLLMLVWSSSPPPSSTVARRRIDSSINFAAHSVVIYWEHVHNPDITLNCIRGVIGSTEQGITAFVNAAIIDSGPAVLLKLAS